MTKDYEPPPDAAKTFAQYKEHYEGERDQKPQMIAFADRELQAGATVGQLAKLTGLTPEVFRRRARTLGIELKRPPTVGKLAATPPSPPTEPPAPARPRPATATPVRRLPAPPKVDPGRGPEMSAERARALVKLARKRASDTQNAGLDQTAQSVPEAYRAFAVVAEAQAMGLLTTAELHHVDEED